MLEVLEADLSKSTMTTYFAKEFPRRHINVGNVLEADMMATAAGFMTTGKIPFASTLRSSQREEPISN